MVVQHITSAHPGVEHWTLRCTECRLIHEARINAEPTKFGSVGLRHGGAESATVTTMI